MLNSIFLCFSIYFNAYKNICSNYKILKHIYVISRQCFYNIVIIYTLFVVLHKIQSVHDCVFVLHVRRN